MLTYDLSTRSTEPLYEFLYRSIRNDITSGRLQPGERLPSKRSLAQHLSVGIVTVANAYQQLVTEGFVRSEERRGFFVENISTYRYRPERAKGVGASTADPGPDPALNAVSEPVPDPSSDPALSPDPTFFADMKANRTSVSLFPTSVWARLMRQALSLPATSLLDAVPWGGLPELQRSLATYLKRTRNMDVSPNQIIIGAGSEYLFGRLLQMFGTDTTFAVEDPGYKKLAAISSAFGCPWRPVPIDEEGLVVDALERSGADVVHVSPASHFPTGIIMPITRRLELFEWANRARGRYIIEDDYDSELRYNNHLILPLYAEDVSDKVIYLNTFSKVMVPSLRISYMVLPPKLLERYVDTMSFYSCTVSSFEQYALARFIEEGHLERHINRVRTFYRAQRTRVLAAIAESPLGGVSEVIERNAGTHFLLHVRTSLAPDDIRARGRELGLNLSLFDDYRYANHLANSPTLVINYAGIDPDNVEETIARLACVFPERAAREAQTSKSDAT